jgi:hypothetical protein
MCFSCIGSGVTRRYKTKLERLAKDRLSSLLLTFVKIKAIKSFMVKVLAAYVIKQIPR